MNKVGFIIIGLSLLALAGTTLATSPQWCFEHPHECSTTTTSTTTSVSTTQHTTTIHSCDEDCSSSTITSTVSSTTIRGEGNGSGGGIPCYTCMGGDLPVYFWNVFTGHVEEYYPFTNQVFDTGISINDWHR